MTCEDAPRQGPTAAEHRARVTRRLDELYSFAKQLASDPECGDEDDPGVWATAAGIVRRHAPLDGESAADYGARVSALAREALRVFDRPCVVEALSIIRSGPHDARLP